MDGETERNREALEGLIEVWCGDDLEQLDDVMAEDVVVSDSGTEAVGIEAYKDTMGRIRSALPDLEVEIHDVVVDAETGATFYTYRGTHEGELWGIEPTGKPVELQEVSLVQFEDGIIVRETVVWDTLELFRQLGIDPAEA